MRIVESRADGADTGSRRSRAAETCGRGVGYDLMQETNGHYDHVLLGACDTREARRLGWLWHAEHHGQTVISHHDADGQTTIVAILDR